MEYRKAVERGFVGEPEEYEELRRNQEVREQQYAPSDVGFRGEEWCELLGAIGIVALIVIVEYLVVLVRNPRPLF